jgi:hypothetical protein
MALDGSDTVFSDDIVDGEVRTPDIADGAVKTGKLALNSVNSARVVDDSLRSEDIFDGQIHAIDVAFGTLRGDEIQDGTIGGGDISDNDLTGDDVNESTLGTVPQAHEAITAMQSNVAYALRQERAYIRTASVVVPGGSQVDSNGNGLSRAVQVFCDVGPTFLPDLAIGGGAFWSGNANSNSDELENRIHSAAFITNTGTPATSGEIPLGYRARGEVDKDGNDTLTVQVLCYPRG